MQMGSTNLSGEVQSAPPTKVEKTWFLERENGEVIAVGETEAYSLLHPQQPNAKRFRLVGTSDGKKYVEIIKTAGIEKQSIQNQVRAKSSDITRYLNTLDKFKFEELLDDTDPKVIKVREIIASLQLEIDKLNEGLANIQKLVVDKAFQAELEIARKTPEQPRKNDVFSPGGNSEEVRRYLRV
jgi:FtsZ-binding cell division protein ZapB